MRSPTNRRWVFLRPFLRLEDFEARPEPQYLGYVDYRLVYQGILTICSSKRVSQFSFLGGYRMEPIYHDLVMDASCWCSTTLYATAWAYSSDISYLLNVDVGGGLAAVSRLGCSSFGTVVVYWTNPHHVLLGLTRSIHYSFIILPAISIFLGLFWYLG